MGVPIERLPGASIRGRWGRLLSESDAAEYLAISRTTIRELDLSAKRIGRRVLYDIRDLDRFVDRMMDLPGAPVSEGVDPAAAADEERRFFEKRERRRGQN